jgi:hypothetical protein
MCDPLSISIGTALGASGSAAAALGGSVLALGASGAMGAYGQYQQGQVAKQVGRNNQIAAEYAAADAVKRGEEQAIDVRRKADQIKGAQRSRMAAAGLDLTTGTPAELQAQTDFFGQQDVYTTRTNANREAWSLRNQGVQAQALGRAEARQANLSAFSTLLSTAGQTASKWKTYGGN